MKNKLLTILFSFIFIFGLHSKVNAGAVERYFNYETNSSLTADNLNGNFDNLVNEINGGLDQTNIRTGYRLFELLGSVPAAGTQGRIVYDTTNNTLNFDTGSSFYKVVGFVGTPVQGDVIYHDGTAWNRLAAGTSGYFLKTQGAGANPVWSDWDIGSYELRAQTLQSDIATGTAPMTISSTTKVNNLNVDSVDGNHFDSVVQGDLLYGSATSTLSSLNKSTSTFAVLTNTGTNNNPAWSTTKQLFTSSGVFTAPTGITTVYITMVGGGGGGGGALSDNHCGSGGGGGGQIVKYPYTVTPTNNYTITINSGGAGGIGANNGADGGTVSFGTGTVITVAGGEKGLQGSAGTVLGGKSGGDSTIANGTATVGFGGNGGQNGVFTTNSGNGGGSIMGTGGAGKTGIGNGNAASGYGAGGSGAWAGSSKTGGAGTNGICFIEW